MKILVLGLGSMGKRRIRNLRELKIEIIGFDTNENRKKEAVDLYGIQVTDSINAALEKNPDGIIISTPPDKHKEHALIAIKKKIPFFTEVNTMPVKDMQEIIDMCEKNNVRGMPSCNVAFHPSMKRIRKILEEKKIGRMLAFYFHSGAYLPDWHPWENMSDYYVHKKNTGGGRDQIMWELSWIFQILGRPKTVFAHTKKLGDFNADIFDIYDLQIEFESGILGSIVVDVIQRPPSRYCDIIGTKGTLKWDYDDKAVRYWSIEEKKWISYPEKDDCYGYPVERPKPGFASKDLGMAESYIDEMKEFVKVIKGSNPTFTYVNEKFMLKTMFEAEISSEKGVKRDLS